MLISPHLTRLGQACLNLGLNLLSHLHYPERPHLNLQHHAPRNESESESIFPYTSVLNSFGTQTLFTGH